MCQNMQATNVLCSNPKGTCYGLNPWWHALCLKQVVYWEDDTKPETMGKVRVPWNQTSVTVSGLAGNAQHFLTVSAFNTAGTGPFLPAINVTTKKQRKLQHKCLIRVSCIYLESHSLIYSSIIPQKYDKLCIMIWIIFISCSTRPAATECWMDPNWLSTVSLLGTCGGDGIRVRSYRLPSECSTVSKLHSSMCISERVDLSCVVACSKLSEGMLACLQYKVSPTLFFLPHSAVIQETET